MIFVIISFLSVLVSPDSAFSFYNCYNLVGRYVLTYYLVVQSIDLKKYRTIKKYFLSCISLSLFIVVIYGFMQAFLGIGLTSEQIVWTDGAMFPGLKNESIFHMAKS